MTPDQQGRTGARWLALLALPVLCCVGHGLLLAAGVGSLTALTGVAADNGLLVAAGALLLAFAAVLLVRRQRR